MLRMTSRGVCGLRPPRGVPQRADNVFARNHAHELTVRVEDRKATRLQAHHQLQDARQWRRRLNVDERFGHHLSDRTPHQLVVVGYQLVGGEGKGLEEVELGHKAQHASLLQHRKRIEVVSPKQGFQLAQGGRACHAHHLVRHVLIHRAFEKAIGWSGCTLAPWHGSLLSA